MNMYRYMYKGARADIRRRPLRSINEADRTTCEADRGQKALTTWDNGRLAKAKSSVVPEKQCRADKKFNAEQQEKGKRKKMRNSTILDQP